MKKLLFASSFGLLFFSCSNDKKESVEQLEFPSIKQELSYIAGAEHSRMLFNSNDPNINQFNMQLIAEGFSNDLENPHPLTQECRAAIQNLYGPDQMDFNIKYLDEACKCMGSSIAEAFVLDWTKMNALDSLDLEFVKIGFLHGVEKRDTMIPLARRKQIFQSFVQQILIKKKEQNLALGDKMLLEAKEIPNAKVLDNGSVLIVLEEGKGKSPLANDDVKADYILTNALGDTIQSSFDFHKMGRPTPIFNLAQVVRGWTEAFPNMKKGGKYRLYLPGELAYADQSQFEPLIFYIEVLDFGPAGSLVQPNPQGMIE